MYEGKLDGRSTGVPKEFDEKNSKALFSSTEEIKDEPSLGMLSGDELVTC